MVLVNDCRSDVSPVINSDSEIHVLIKLTAYTNFDIID